MAETPASRSPSQSRVQLAAGARPLPDYELVECLGRGGFGEVWKAKGPGGFAVALKFIRLADAGSRVELRSLELMKDISHPHLIVQFGAWQLNDFLIVAMELAKCTLADRLREAREAGEQGIPRKELMVYLFEAARGLDHLHSLKIQHRDVKPQNLLLAGGGVKVADFGLARLVESALTNATGSMTMAYAAPELFKNQVSEHTDQYALAVTYCELRSGQLPFEGPPAVLMAGHLIRPPDLSMLPEAEHAAVARALAKKPAERWPSCRAFVEGLLQVGKQRRTTASAPKPSEPLSDMAPQLQSAPRPQPPVAPRQELAPPSRLTGKQQQNQAPAPSLGAPPSDSASPALPPLSPVPPWTEPASPPGQETALLVWDRHPWWATVVIVFPFILFLFLVWVMRSHRSDNAPSANESKLEERKKNAEPGPPWVVKTIKNSLGMEFALVPRGSFWMGGGGGAPGGKQVEIPYDFYLGVYEVTQEQWQAVMGNNPSSFSRSGFLQDRVATISDADLKLFPVEMVSWDDVREFITKLNDREKDREWVYRLPREVEWEFACRGGATSKEDCSWHCYFDQPTNELTFRQANFGNGLKRTSKVGSYRPNRLGIYDLHGNVLEWCEDSFDIGSTRVRRGGGWDHSASDCFAASRGSNGPTEAYGTLGLRLARVPSGR